MLNVLFWIIFGFLTGWIGVILASTEKDHPRTAPIILAGVIGGTVGGASVQLLTASSLTTTHSPISLFGAVLLAAIMVLIAAMLSQEPTSR